MRKYLHFLFILILLLTLKTFALPIGTCGLSFDGNNDFVNIPDSSTLDFTNAFTLEAWVYAEPSNWLYKKTITITNNTSYDLENYVINLNINYISGKMRQDFGDIRFIDECGEFLSYWIESFTSGSSAKFWVKIPFIPANSSVQIYMYYGNLYAQSDSDGEDVFLFFDDFNDPSELNSYIIEGSSSCTYNINNSKLIINCPDNRELGILLDPLNMYSRMNPGLEIRGYLYTSNWYDGAPRQKLLYTTGNNLAYAWGPEGYGFFISDPRDNEQGASCLTDRCPWISKNGHIFRLQSVSSSANNYYTIIAQLLANGSIKYTLYRGSSQLAQITGNDLDFQENYIGVGNGESLDQWEWVFARPYIEPEPFISIGNEVSVNNAFGPIISKGGAYNLALNQYVTPNSWHHIALTYDGNYLNYYVDSVLVSSCIRSGNLLNEEDPLKIGSIGNTYFGGKIDEVAVYNRALSPTEIYYHYNHGFGTPINPSTNGLKGLWHFDEGSGQTVQDSSSNSNDGTLGANSNPNNDDPSWYCPPTPTPGPLPTTNTIGLFILLLTLSLLILLNLIRKR